MSLVLAKWRTSLGAAALLALGELVLAALAVAPGGLALAADIGRRPAATVFAAGDWLHVLVDLHVASGAAQQGITPSPMAGASAAPTPLGAIAAWTLVLGTIAAALHSLLYAFLSGAALEQMMGRGSGLWRGGTRWFPVLLRLGVILFFLVPLLGAGMGVALLFVPGNGFTALALKGAVWVVWMAGVGGFFELARVLVVLHSDRSAFVAVRRAARMCAARPLALAGLWLALGAGNWLLSALIVLLTLGTSANSPGLAWAIALFTIAGGTGFKMLRLAAATNAVLVHVDKL